MGDFDVIKLEIYNLTNKALILVDEVQACDQTSEFYAICITDLRNTLADIKQLTILSDVEIDRLLKAPTFPFKENNQVGK